MDPTTVVITLGIAAYGILEFRHREAQHRRHLADIRKGLQPVVQEQRTRLWQVLTAGTVLVLISAFLAVLVWLEFRTGFKAGAYTPLVAFFGVLFILVSLIVLRILVSYIRWRDRP